MWRYWLHSLKHTVGGRNPANQLIVDYLKGFIHPRWLFGISSINSTSLKNAAWETIFLWGLSLLSGHVFNFSEGSLSHTRTVLGRNLFNFANAQRQSDPPRTPIFSLTWIICPWTPIPWKIKVLHPQKKGYNPKKWRLWVPMVYCIHIIPGIKFTFNLMGKCRPEMLQQLPFKTWFLEKSHLLVTPPASGQTPNRTLALQQKIPKKCGAQFQQYTYLTKHPASKSYKSIKHDNDYSAGIHVGSIYKKSEASSFQVPNPIGAAIIDSRIRPPKKSFSQVDCSIFVPEKSIQLNVIVLQKKTSHPDIIKFDARIFFRGIFLKKHLGKPFLSFGGSLWFTNRQISGDHFFLTLPQPNAKKSARDELR